jgi:hypothetical protein
MINAASPRTRLLRAGCAIHFSTVCLLHLLAWRRAVCDAEISGASGLPLSRHRGLLTGRRCGFRDSRYSDRLRPQARLVEVGRGITAHQEKEGRIEAAHWSSLYTSSSSSFSRFRFSSSSSSSFQRSSSFSWSWPESNTASSLVKFGSLLPSLPSSLRFRAVGTKGSLEKLTRQGIAQPEGTRSIRKQNTATVLPLTHSVHDRFTPGKWGQNTGSFGEQGRKQSGMVRTRRTLQGGESERHKRGGPSEAPVRRLAKCRVRQRSLLIP